jgi:hypothetical protein
MQHHPQNCRPSQSSTWLALGLYHAFGGHLFGVSEFLGSFPPEWEFVLISDVIAKVSSFNKIIIISYIGIRSFSVVIILSQATKDREKKDSKQLSLSDDFLNVVTSCTSVTSNIMISGTPIDHITNTFVSHRRKSAQTVSSCAECL